MTLLTIQQQDLIPDWQVPVLYYPFREDDFYYRGERTAMKITNTIRSLTDGLRQVVLPTYPMISSPPNRI